MWKNIRFYRRFVYTIVIIRCFFQNVSKIGPNRSGTVPDHSQTLLGNLWDIVVCEKLQDMSNNHEKLTNRKTELFMENNNNKKVTHCNDLNCDGPMISPSSIWSPFVKKCVLTQMSKKCRTPFAKVDLIWQLWPNCLRQKLFLITQMTSNRQFGWHIRFP